MHICAILNKDGGTLQTMDADQFAEEVRQKFKSNGHSIDIEIVSGPNLIKTLDQVAQNGACDAILAGGGDGTISAAAKHCWQHDKTLAVIPAGTMNLFARSLGLPLNLSDALDALATAKERSVDVATVNGELFFASTLSRIAPKDCENARPTKTSISVPKDFWRHQSGAYHIQSATRLHNRADVRRRSKQ